MASYADARHAKAVAKDFLKDVPEATGFGIAVIGDLDYGVKINLTGPMGALILPQTISGGVPLVIEVVGQVKAT